MGRQRQLNDSHLRIIDAWYSRPGRKKRPPAKVIAAKLGVSTSTLSSAARRAKAYMRVPR